MGRVSARVTVPGRIHDAEELWYAPVRWPTWRDGFGHLATVEGEWPAVDAVANWDGVVGGRGRVVERVLAHEPRVGQTLAVEDRLLRGTERVAFSATQGETTVTLTLAYNLKNAGPWPALREVARFNRPLRQGLERTLARFARELRAERELSEGW